MNCCRKSDGQLLELSALSQECKPLTYDDDRSVDQRTVDVDSDAIGPRKQVCAYMSLLLSIILACFGLMCAQLLDRSIPHAELNGFRYLLQFAVSSIALFGSKHWDLRIERDKIGWVILGSILQVIVSICSYGQAYYLPLGTATGTTYSMELLGVYLISCVLKRSVEWDQSLAVCLCIAGVVLVVQPPFIFKRITPSVLDSQSFHSTCAMTTDLESFELTSNEYMNENITAIYNGTSISPALERHKRDNLIGYILVAVDVTMQVGHIQLLKYKLHDINVFLYVFWASGFGCLASFSLMGAVEDPALPRMGLCLTFMLVHMTVSATHKLFGIYGYQIAPPTISALIGTMAIPGTFVLQYSLLSGMYPGHANPLEILGASIIVLGNVIVPVHAGIKYCS